MNESITRRATTEEELKDIANKSSTKTVTTEEVIFPGNGDVSNGTNRGEVSDENKSVTIPEKGNHDGMDGYDPDANRRNGEEQGEEHQKIKNKSNSTAEQYTRLNNTGVKWVESDEMYSILQNITEQSREHYERLRNFIIAAILSQVFLAITAVAIFLIALHWKFQQLHMSREIVPEILEPLDT